MDFSPYLIEYFYGSYFEFSVRFIIYVLITKVSFRFIWVICLGRISLVFISLDSSCWYLHIR